MNEELLALTNAFDTEDTPSMRPLPGAGLTLGNAVGEGFRQIRELTPEIREASTGVVNENRKNRMTGVSNFLANPEVQMALLSFGRAFSANDPNSAGTILANTGEELIKGQANARALKAAEEGGDIAGAGGTFADSTLVAGLQTRREDMELAQARLGLDRDKYTEAIRQFDESIDLDAQRVKIQELGVENDIALGWARVNLDEEQFNSRLDLLERDAAVNEKLAEADVAYKNFLISQGPNDKENLSLRTNEFLGILDEQLVLIDENISQVQGILDKTLPGWWRRGFPIGAEYATRANIRAAAKEARDRGINITEAEEDEAISAAALASGLQREINALQKKKGSINIQKESLVNAQTARLGGTNVPPPDGEDTPLVDIEPGNLGALDTPYEIQPNNLTQGVENVPTGGYFKVGGITYRKTANGFEEVSN